MEGPSIPSVPILPDEEENLPAGARLGKYQIVRLLGAGGMGAVYEAVHTEIGKRVAIKTLGPAVAAIPGARQRFLREAQLTSRLRHPHVVDLTDMGSEGRIAYLVMELLAGEDLSQRLERTGPLPPRELVDLMLPVCSALIAAHDLGIVHRDLKPQNIFLASGHQGVQSKVLDFGISKSSDTDASSSLTSTGSVIGTPHYLAPEQIKDARSASPASDQYSLGVIFYRCLTDVSPFEGESIFAILQAIVTETPVPLRTRRPDLPEGLAEVVARAMSPMPWDRFSSVRELGRALLPFASARARVIWEETFAVTGGLGQVVEPPRESHTMAAPTPLPRPARSAGQLTTAKARIDSGTLSPAVISTNTSIGLGTARAARSRKLIGVVVGVAVAAFGWILFSRASRGPETKPIVAAPAPVVISAAPVSAAPVSAAPAPAAPPPVEVSAPPPPARPPKDDPVAAATPKDAPLAPAAHAEEPKERPTPRRRSASSSSSSSRHGSGRAHPEAPAASPRSLNPNGAPVID